MITVICLTVYEESDWELTRSYSSQSEVKRRFVGGRRPQRSASAMVSGNCSTFPLCQHPAYGTGWQSSKWWSASQHFTDGQSHLKTEIYEVVSA